MTHFKPAWCLALLLAFGCPTTPPRDNPLDPKSPVVAPGAVTGTLSFDLTGQALGDVQLSQAVAAIDGLPEVNVDSTGSFTVQNVAPGEHTLELRALYYSPLRLEKIVIGPGQTVDLGALVLRRGRGQLSGAVLVAGREMPDGGCPAGATTCGDHSGTQVSVADHPADEPRFTITNLPGEYQLGDVAAGKRRLTFRRDGYDPASIADIELLPDERKRLPDYTLGIGFSARVSGHVVLEGIDPPGAEYSQVTVLLQGGVASTQADDQGAFLVSSPLGGTFTLVLSLAGYERREVPGVQLRPNATVDLDALLQGPIYLRRARGAVTGLVDVLGATDDGVIVCGEGTALCASSTATGSFRIDDVPSGLSFKLLATKRVGLDEFAGSSGQRTVAVGAATDFGLISVSKISGDFELEGRSISPNDGQLQSNRAFTVEDWVRIDLTRVRQPGYDFFSSAQLDGGFSPWVSIPSNAPFCPDAGASSPLCAFLPAEGPSEVRIKLANALDGGTQPLGPFKGGIRFDRTAPSNARLVINGGAPWLNENSFGDLRLEVSATDTSPLLNLRIATVSEPADPLTALDTVTVVPFDALPSRPVPDPTQENEKRVAVRIYDAAGNSAQATATIKLDRTAPSPVTLTIDKNDAGFVTQSLVKVTAAVDAGIADVASVRLSNDATWVPFVAVPTSATSLTTAWLLPGGDGTALVYAQFVDQAGNVSRPAASASVTVDTTPPLTPLVSLSENPCAGGTDTIPNGYTHHATVCVTVAPNPDVRQVLVDGCSAPPSGNPAQFDCALAPAGNGPKTITVTAIDAAGNRSGASSRSLVLDTTPPAKPTLSIVQTGTSSSPKYVNSQIVAYGVTLGLPIDTDLSQMQLEQTLPAPQKTPWQPFAPSGLNFLVNASQVSHPVSVRVRDLAENESVPSDPDPVILDTVAPVAPAVTMAARNAQGFVQSATGLQLVVAGPTSSIDSNYASLEVVGASSCGASCLQAGLTFTLDLLPNTASFLRVRARDLAGNVGAEHFLPVTHDSVPPAAPSIASPVNDPCTNPPEPYTSASTQLVNITSYVPETNFDGFQLQASTTACAAATTGWATTANTNGFLFGLNSGANFLCVRALDRAGNPSATAAQVQVVRDSTPPSAPSFGPDQKVNSDTVLLHLGARATDSSPLVLQVIGGPYADWTPLPLGCALTRPPATPYPASCPPLDAGSCAFNAALDGGYFVELATLEDREQLFFFRAVDTAGNASGVAAPVSVTERSTWQLTSGGAGSYYDRPSLEGDRVVWQGSEGVQLFDLLRQDSELGDLGRRVDVGAVPGSWGVSTFGNLVTWSDGADISHCRIDADSGVCGPISTVVTAGLNDRFPIATGSRIISVRSGADAGITVLDLDGGTSSTLAYGPIRALSARRVFDGAGAAFDLNVAHARVSWVTSSLAINTQRTDSAVPVQLSTGVLAAGIWADARTVLWDTGPAAQSKSVVACVEPFAANCTPASLLGPGPFRDAAGFVEPSRIMVGAISDRFAFGRPIIASSTATSSREHVIDGFAFQPWLQAGKLVYGRTAASGRISIELWDTGSTFTVDPLASATAAAVSGSVIAWLDDRAAPASGSVDLFTAHLATGQLRNETQGPASFRGLAMDFPWVVWEQQVGGGVCPAGVPCVRFLNLATRATGRVASSVCAPAMPCTPRMSGSRVAWTDSRGASADVYAFDLAVVSPEIVVANTAASETASSISGERVVWREAPNLIQTRNLVAAAGCPAITECLAGPSGCKFNRASTLRNNPSVFAPAGNPCGALAAWEEDGLLTRIGVYDWARAAGRLLDDDLKPAPAQTAHWGIQTRPIVSAGWVAFQQVRVPTGSANAVRLYWWRADAIGTVALGTADRRVPATDGATVVFVEGVGNQLRAYRPVRVP